MGIFGRSKRKEIPKEEFTVRISAEPLDRLTPEGDLPWGWWTANKAFTSQLQAEYTQFLNAWLESRRSSDAEQYAALKSFVIYMNDVKKLCESKGECFVYWRDTLFTDKYLLEETTVLKQLEDKLKKE